MPSREDDLINKLKNCVGPLPPSHCSSLSKNGSLIPSHYSSLSQNGSLPSEVPQLRTLTNHKKQWALEQRQTDRLAVRPRPQSPRLYSDKNMSEFRMDRYESMQRQSVCNSFRSKGENKTADYSYKGLSSHKKNLKDVSENIPTPNTEIKQQLSSKYSYRSSVDNAGITQVKTPLAPSGANQFPPYCQETRPAFKTTSRDLSSIVSKYKREPLLQAPSVADGSTRSGEVQSQRGQLSVANKGGVVGRGSGEKGFRLKGEGREGECSALQKLKKISELNQKINERIRNIITVFQEQK